MKYIHYVLGLLLLGCTLLMAEPSVYGNNGGFVSSDKKIAENKNTIDALNRMISQQKEQIDGLKSIVEGLNATVHELQERIEQKSTTQTSSTDNVLLQDLGKMIDEINANYVSKKELSSILGKKVADKPSISTNVKKDISSSQLYSEGVRLFVKHRYDDAIKRFVLTDKKAYKAAASNYYLGESSYYTKKYNDAIFYYKKSAALDDKASYIDTLLLHTAISLENVGKKEQAKVFYENIISNYGSKKTAKIAQDKLNKL